MIIDIPYQWTSVEWIGHVSMISSPRKHSLSACLLINEGTAKCLAAAKE